MRKSSKRKQHRRRKAARKAQKGAAAIGGSAKLGEVVRRWGDTARQPDRSKPRPGRREVVMEMVVRADQARDEDRSIPVVVASENAIPGFGRSWELVDQVLIIDRANQPKGAVTLIDSHNSYSVQNTLGSVREWAIEKDPETQLAGRMFFSDTEVGRDAYANYRDGHLNDVSIRAYATEVVMRIEAGKTAKVKGRTLTAGVRPMDVFIRWSAYEVSAVIKGADEEAKVRRSAEEERDMKFTEWLVQRGHKVEELDEARRAELHAEYLTEREEAQRTELRTELRAEVETTVRAEITAETQRAGGAPPAEADIQKTVAEAVSRAVGEAMTATRKETAERVAAVREVCRGEHPEVERQAIAEGWDAARTSTACLEAVRKQLDSGVGAPAILVKRSEVSRDLLVDALVVRAGGGDDIVAEDKEHGEERAERASELRSISLEEVCREALAIEGKQAPRGREEMLRAAVSTFTLPQVLGNVANKFAMKGHKLASATWRAWCSIGSVKDFKQNTGVRLTDVGDLEEVTQDAGEIKDGGATEEYEQFTLARYAKKVIISEINIINDDLGMLTKIPQNLGARAASLISKLVYTHLLANGNMQDGTALFASGHSNLVTGTSYKLSAGAAALRKALEYFRKQTDSDGESLDVEPSVVLCAPEDEEYARALLVNIELAGGSTAGTPKANIWGTMGLSPVPESRLSNSNYTGYSTTAWYLMGNPNQVDTVQVSFLNGKQAPVLQYFNQQQMGIDVIAVGYRVIQDATVKALDHRGMVKMTGTT